MGAWVLHLFGVVVVRTGVHVRIRHSKVLPDISTDPVVLIRHVHRLNICFVLTRAWHIKILSPSVNLHTERKLGLLLSWSSKIVRVARIGEVKVAWDIILRTWHSHELDLITLLLLNIPDS